MFYDSKAGSDKQKAGSVWTGAFQICSDCMYRVEDRCHKDTVMPACNSPDMVEKYSARGITHYRVPAHFTHVLVGSKMVANCSYYKRVETKRAAND